MKYYMIFYRPEGSTTFTTCGEHHGLKANLFKEHQSAIYALISCAEMYPEHIYKVFECRPVSGDMLSVWAGQRIDT